MLKGFVSGEEKDIKRIPMKGKNLFDKSAQAGQIYVTDSAQRYGVEIPVYSGTYTVSGGTSTSFAKTKIGAVYGEAISLNAARVFTLASDGYMLVYAARQADYDEAKDGIMLNTGSQALPYEPYGYQEGWEVRDNQDRLIWGREDELQTATGTLPFKGYNLPVKVKSLLGNAVQNGTPAPDNIIMPEMCGKLVGTDWTIPLTNAGQTTPVYLGEVPTVRRVSKRVLDGTENWVGNGGSFYADGVTDYLHATYTAFCSHFPTSPNVSSRADAAENSLCFGKGSLDRIFFKWDSFATVGDLTAYLAAQYQNGTPVTVWYVLANEQTGITNEPLCKISTYADELTTIQVHGLSAPLYGIGDYKDTLNLSTGVVTRKVKKLVLKGTEQFNIDGNLRFTITVNDTIYYAQGRIGRSYCSHYECLYHEEPYDNDWNNVYYQNGRTFFFHDRRFADVSGFKAFIAAQYAAGTPVCFWYVLETPTTGTITVPTGMTGEIEGYLTQVSTPSPTNRSVPKWNGVEETGGTYAVTVYTPPEIPTTTGQNTLTVDTTLKPSNLTVKGHIKELT